MIKKTPEPRKLASVFRYAEKKGISPFAFSKRGRASSAILFLGKGRLKGMSAKEIPRFKASFLKITNLELSRAIREKKVNPNRYEFRPLKNVYVEGKLFMENPPSFNVEDFVLVFESKRRGRVWTGEKKDLLDAAAKIAAKMGFSEKELALASREIRNHINELVRGKYLVDCNDGNILVRGYDRKTGKFTFTLIDL